MYLRVGTKNSDVTLVQNALRVLNYPVGIADGDFGPKTEQAVISFQINNNLEADGIVGGCTWDVLCKSIKDIQEKLNNFGANLIVDGIVGANTISALLNFQIANNLTADGIIGINTLDKLTDINSCKVDYSISFSQYDISDMGVNFIADYEKYYAEPYRGLDYENETIGYGHVIREGEHFTYLSKVEAKQLLIDDLRTYVADVNRLVAGIYLSQNQFDALVSFGYNVGTGEGGLKDSTLLKCIKNNSGSGTIRAEFMKWCHCHKERALGLYRRRNDEANMYIKGIYNRTYIDFED